MKGFEVNDYTLKRGFEDYIKYQKVKNLSEHSINFYETCYMEFTRFISENTLLKEISQETMQNYILHLKEKDIVDITVNTYIRGIRAFMYYLMERGLVDIFKIKLIKADKTIKNPYTDEELKKLLIKPNLKECRFSEYRNWVIVNFLCGTGCRLRTLINVKIQDIDFENNIIRFKVNKNRRENIIPLSNTLSSILLEYLQHRNYNKEEEYLFCTMFGGQLKKESIQSAIEKYNKNRGINKTSVHLFRHAFCRNFIMSGGDIFRLQSIVGHSDLSVLRGYISIYGKDLNKDFEKFCTLDQIGKIESRKAIKMKR